MRAYRRCPTLPRREVAQPKRQLQNSPEHSKKLLTHRVFQDSWCLCAWPAWDFYKRVQKRGNRIMTRFGAVQNAQTTIHQCLQTVGGATGSPPSARQERTQPHVHADKRQECTRTCTQAHAQANARTRKVTETDAVLRSTDFVGEHYGSRTFRHANTVATCVRAQNKINVDLVFVEN